MTGTDAALAMVLVGLFVSAVILGAAEAALLRVQLVRVEVRSAAGDRGAQRLLALLNDLPRVLNTVLLTVLLVQIGAATAVGALAGRHTGNIGVTISSIVLTLLLFVYAEAIPKTYAVRHPYRVARDTAPLVAFLTWALRPLVSLLVALADLQSPGSGIATPAGVTEEELRKLAADAAAAGSIDESDLELIERAFRLGDRTVDEALTPRIDVVAVPADATAREALDLAVRTGHRRLLVVDGDLDHVHGAVRLRDLAAAVTGSPTVPVGELAVRVLTVPETKRLVDALSEMQDSGIHLAVVVDEYGGTAGIVTIEDVVEELVGPVSDEGEASTPPVRPVGPHHWRFEAAVATDEVESATGASLPVGDWHTIGGLLCAVAGRIPRPGEVFEVGGIEFTVVTAGPNRVGTVEATRADQGASS